MAIVRYSAALLLASFVLTAPVLSAHAQSANRVLAPKAPCASLTGFEIPASKIALPTKGAKISSAVLQAGTGNSVPAADFIPEHCKITGAIAPVDPNAPPINFELDIPTNWNGKSYHVGGNGSNGFIPLLVNLPRDFQGSPTGGTLPPHSQNPIARGYAMYGDDSGHGGATPPGPARSNDPGPGQPIVDNSWVKNDEAYENFGYKSIKKTHDAAMAVITQLYGVAPKIKYFGGESQGGREALQAATKYYVDYDGVLSSVPLVNFSSLLIARPLRIRAQFDKAAWLPAGKGALIGQETMRVCDPLDGITDGVINNYAACNRLSDPKVTAKPWSRLRCASGADEGDSCLSDKQLATLAALHSSWPIGVKLNNGETNAAAFPTGLEQRGGWAETLRTWPDPAHPPTPQAGYHLTMRYADKPGGGDLMTNSPQQLASQLQNLSAILDPKASDMQKFIAKGGKLILYSSANDYLANPLNAVRFYEGAQAASGKAAVERSIRFYMTPMAPHGSASYAEVDGPRMPTPAYADLLGALESWVEQGKTPPDSLVQTHESKTAPYTVSWSRPLCRYPSYPRYRGAGDPKVIANYSCAAP